MKHRKPLRLLCSLLVAFLAVGLIWICGVFLLEIPGEGERPVFLPGDRVTVLRPAYGLRLMPMRWWGYARWGYHPVGRGEWVAFNDPSVAGGDTCIDERDVFVGFCYAVPGDSLWVDSLGRVFHRKPHGVRPLRAVELPRAGAYVPITPDNIRWYNHIINLHEGVHSTIIGDSLHVSGHFVTSFRFRHDYYWMSSANARNTADSRTFGFVPHTHIIGKLGCVLFSWDSRAPWYARLRARRTLMKVGRENVEPQKHRP